MYIKYLRNELRHLHYYLEHNLKKWKFSTTENRTITIIIILAITAIQTSTISVILK
jgi:hypothetical protein